MHGWTWRELEGNRPDHGHQGTDNRPGNRRHEGPGSYRQPSSTFQFPTRLGCRSLFGPGHEFTDARRGGGHDVQIARVGRQVVTVALHLEEHRHACTPRPALARL